MTIDKSTAAFSRPERGVAGVPAGVAVVGAGRLGTALVAALRATGSDVRGPLGRGATAPAQAVVLCVPDSEIPDAAAAVAGTAPLVGHTSGATALGVLEPAGGAAFGLHPLQSFAGGEPPERFHGAGCAVAGSSSHALEVAAALARRVGMRPFPIADGDRPAYHAAASIASNFVVTLQGAAEEVAAAAGIEPEDARALLAPLVRASVENWAALGPGRALTGPVARGDEGTVAAQRAALDRSLPHLLPLFDELAEQTRSLARRAATA